MAITFYIKLTLAVYKVSEFFPEQAALKHDIRNLANDILVGLINNHENVSRNIDKIKGLFKLAGAENWVDSRNFAVLSREYDKIAEFIKKQATSPVGKVVDKLRKSPNRKQVILAKLKENGKIKVGELAKIFPSINRRTLLRDLETFSQDGLIVKNGSGRGSCYSVRNATL